MWLAFGTQTRELRDGELVVGSGADADWRIGTADLMPRHFTITIYELNASLKATSRDNVVVVNDKQLVGVPRLLNDGDVIRAGNGRFLFSDSTARPDAAAPDRLRPAYLLNETSGRGRELISRSTTLGRDTSSAIVIDDASVSRYHAELRREAGGFALHSMGSAGTLVNGRKVLAPTMLGEGDIIEIAKRRWRFTHVPPRDEIAVPRDPGGNQWRARAPETRMIDVITPEPAPSRRRTTTIIAGAVILLVVLVGFLLVARA
jgi:pSer/pThr/pTyr-binding forkhead associated (FHA) protein